MSKYKTTGLIEKVFDTQTFNNNFRKREFVLVLGAGEKYQEYPKFQVTGDNCDTLDHIKTREKVEVEFVLKGREWNGKYYNDLLALKVTSLDVRDGVEPEPEPEQDYGYPDGINDDDEVPF